MADVVLTPQGCRQIGKFLANQQGKDGIRLRSVRLESDHHTRVAPDNDASESSFLSLSHHGRLILYIVYHSNLLHLSIFQPLSTTIISHSKKATSATAVVKSSARDVVKTLPTSAIGTRVLLVKRCLLTFCCVVLKAQLPLSCRSSRIDMTAGDLPCLGNF